MSADSEKPNIIGGNWTKYCTVAKSVGRPGAGRLERRSSSARARRLRSAAGSINSGRHILESRCAERCANDAFSTSFRATLRFWLVSGVAKVFPVSSLWLARKSIRKEQARRGLMRTKMGSQIGRVTSRRDRTCTCHLSVYISRPRREVTRPI